MFQGGRSQTSGDLITLLTIVDNVKLNCLCLKFFHVIFSACNLLQVTGIRESKVQIRGECCVFKIPLTMYVVYHSNWNTLRMEEGTTVIYARKTFVNKHFPGQLDIGHLC